MIARLYASTYPDSVAGLVLEDALSEGLYDGLTAAHREVIEALNLLPEPVRTVRLSRKSDLPVFALERAGER